jgi:ABC-type Zn uptake system ZnuABC Zn-binding protein ZnuA
MRRSYLLMLLCLSLLAGCGKPPNFWEEAKPSQKKVLVSFAPLYAITHAVAGEDAYVLCMLTTTGPHAYEGQPTDLFKVNKADLFIYNGLELDDLFVAKILRNHKNASLVTLNVGEVLEKKHHDLMLHAEAHEHADADGKTHKHGEHDPHIWLGPPQAMAMTKIVADKLGEIDSANAKGYAKRAEQLIEELKELEAYGKAAFKNKKNKKIVTTHEAFGYFAEAFGLEIVDAIQKMPGMDADAANAARLAKQCRDEKVAVIAVEPQYSRAQAEALQATLKRDKVDIQIVTLDPLETTDLQAGKKHNPDPKYYLRKMKENIDTLAKALP